jgi:hypothetical protein
MNVLERLKVCSTCQNRKFDPSHGVVCSLTKKKPEFEEHCEHYTAVDNSEAKHIAKAVMSSSGTKSSKTQSPSKDDEGISGLLAFFLYGVVGAGSILGAMLTFMITGGISTFVIALSDNPFIKLLMLLPILYSLLPLASAIAAIVAFNKRDSNAVSATITYLSTSAIYSIVLIILGLALDFQDSQIFTIAIANLAWYGLWFAYLVESRQVAAIIPIATRTWKSFEKGIIVASIVLATVFTISFIYIYENDKPHDKMERSYNSKIELSDW